MRGRSAGVRLALVGALVLAFALLVAPSAAFAISSGIHGTVTDGTSPVNIEVAVYVNDGGVWYFQDSTWTDEATGAYSLGLPVGTYRVCFTDWSSQTYKTEWFNNSSTFAGAQNIVIGASTIYNANATLATWPRGTLQGTVTDSDGVGIEGIAVQTFTWSEIESRWEMGLGSSTQYTDADGKYTFSDTLAQTYLVEFSDEWGEFVPELYNNKFTVASANSVAVTGGGTFTANAALTRIEFGSVAGVVVDAVSGAPASGVSVEGYRPNLWGDWDWGFATDTMSLGDYLATSVPTGDYYVLFQDYSGKYVQEFYPNAADESAATWVGVAPLHTTSGIDASLNRAAHIKGRITAEGAGTPLLAYANLYKWDSTESAWQDQEAGYRTDANGYYDIGGLTPGTYAVGFQDPDQTYFTEFYNGVPQVLGSWDVPAGVQTITLTAGQVRTGVNASLTKGGVITGTVTSSLGGPLSWFAGDIGNVNVYDATTHDHLGWAVGLADESGVYRCGPLPAGDYHVEFDGAGQYTTEYFSEQSSLSAASIVHVTAGTVSAGIDEVLSPTGTWGTVSGSVVDTETGDALCGISVGLIAADGSSWWIDDAETDGKGMFDFDYVQAGEYWLYFQDNANSYYQTVMYKSTDPDAEGWDAAEKITVVGNSDTPVSQRMTPWDDDLGHIKGFVRRDVGSTPIVNAPVNAYMYDPEYEEWNWGSEVYSGFDGSYHMPAYAGTYRLEFGPTFDAAHEYFNNKSTFSSATTVTVAPNGATTANAYLAAARTVSGTVSFNSSPLPWARVEAWGYNSDGGYWDIVGEAYTETDGTYTIGGLNNGATYRFSFTSEDGNFARIWYNEQPGFYMADGVLMNSNKTGIDCTLTEAGVVRGAVVDEDGNRVDEVKVKLWTKTATNEWALVESGTTYSGGDFQFGGLQAPRDYYLEFHDPLGRYHDVWYESVGTSATADAISAVAGDSVVVVQQMVAATTEYLPISGATRIETAIAAANEAFPEGAETVVIATAYNWPDALGGAALAGSYQGPILLTAPADLPESVASAIEDLGATDAIILGSDKAVSNAVKGALEDLLGAGSVTRIGGANRYATANLIAQATVTRLGSAYDGTSFVATGLNFPDALGASPLSAKAAWPIFLADPVKGLDSSTLSMMTTLGVEKALILGSTKAVPALVQTSLNSRLGSSNVVRLAGANRYQTCVAVAQYGVDHVYGLGWNGVAIATGQNFPDALAGGVLQGQKGSVLLLTPGTTLDSTVAAKLAAKKSSISDVTYLGGTNVVTNPVRAAITALLN